jgi:hypothetical protein
MIPRVTESLTMQGAANEMDDATSRKSRNQRERIAGIKLLRWGFLKSKKKKSLAMPKAIQDVD